MPCPGTCFAFPCLAMAPDLPCLSLLCLPLALPCRVSHCFDLHIFLSCNLHCLDTCHAMTLNLPFHSYTIVPCLALPIILPSYTLTRPLLYIAPALPSLDCCLTLPCPSLTCFALPWPLPRPMSLTLPFLDPCHATFLALTSLFPYHALSFAMLCLDPCLALTCPLPWLAIPIALLCPLTYLVTCLSLTPSLPVPFPCFTLPLAKPRPLPCRLVPCLLSALALT